MKNISLPMTCLLAGLLFVFQSCENDQTETPGQTSGSVSKMKIPSISFYALAGGIMLDEYSTSDPENTLNSVMISGLMGDEKILSIDFRPATGQLYGLGSTSRIYVINPETGAARAIGTTSFSPAIEGDVAGFDFNPTVDRIRLVTTSGQNLRLNPETGMVAATDLPINGGGPISAVAYTGNVAGSSATVLYDIDAMSDKLYKQIPPNNGTLVEVGDLGLDIKGEGGFDISAQQDMALAIFEVNKKSTLFAVDLATGNSTTIAKYNKSLKYTGIAIPTQPVAYALGMMNTLLIMNPDNTSAVVSKPITGLMAGETLWGLDFRPMNGQLYALGSTSRLYTINASSGVAAAVGSMFSTPLSGTDFGFDFNPVVDRIRIVSNTGQNLRVNPADGAVIVDGAINPAPTSVSAVAYANNFAGTLSTMLFDIDVNTDKLYLQSPPNNGTLVEIGALGLDASSMSGFDIGGKSGNAYAVLTVNGVTSLYGINKTSGMAISKGALASGVSGFALGLGF